MIAGARWAAAARALALVMLVAACRRETPGPVLGRIVEASGVVATERAGVHVPGGPGLELRAGDAVRTGPGARARVRLESGRNVELGEDALVRLDPGATPAEAQLAIERGEAEVTGDGPLAIPTRRGPVRLAPGGRMRVRASDRDVRFEVLIGHAILGEADAAVSLAAGDGLALMIGGAQLERYRVSVGAAVLEPARAPVPPKPPAAAEPEADPAEAVSPTHRARGEETAADLALPAGESAIIHARHTPLLVQLALDPPCARGGVLELRTGRRAQRISIAAATVVSLANGPHRYRVSCGRRTTASGSLTVRKDAGTASLPRTAPGNTLEADGRRYTVLYQNRLPALTFVWPAAEALGACTLHLDTGGRARSFPSRVCRVRLPSGAVAEGEHAWWFTRADGQVSPRTSLALGFDNATSAAQVQSPADGLRAGDEIEIAGVALEGSTVAVGGAALTVDEQGRFHGQITRPPGHARAIAIRLEHPHSGIHYYVRRLGR